MEQTTDGAMQVTVRLGMSGKPIRDAGMGVYIGISYAEYSQAAAKAVPTVSTYTATGGALSVAAGTVTASCCSLLSLAPAAAQPVSPSLQCRCSQQAAAEFSTAS